MKKIKINIKKPKIRRFWKRKPATQVMQSKKLYRRHKQPEIKDEEILKEEI